MIFNMGGMNDFASLKWVATALEISLERLAACSASLSPFYFLGGVSSSDFQFQLGRQASQHLASIGLYTFADGIAGGPLHAGEF